MHSNIKNLLRCALKAVFGMLFVGFVFPLWWAQNSSFSAVRQIAGDPEFLGHSMPYEELSKGSTTVGYLRLGCCMTWLFWRVTRNKKQES